jgi:hypothetical protein
MTTDAPTFASLGNAIIRFYGLADADSQWFWSDVCEGAAPKNVRRFWDVIRERAPGGTLDEVLAAWSVDELTAQWRELRWGPVVAVDRWFRSRGFSITVRGDDGRYEADLTHVLTRKVVASRYGVGITREAAAERAKERYEQEQEPPTTPESSRAAAPDDIRE